MDAYEQSGCDVSGGMARMELNGVLSRRTAMACHGRPSGRICGYLFGSTFVS